jgi:hypothetical protein
VRLPLYPGTANGQKVWYVLLDASNAGLAHDLGVNYAPKLANIAISGPAAAARQQRAPMAAETWVSSPLCHQPNPPPDIRPEIHAIREGPGQRTSVYWLRSSCTRLV